MSDYEFISDALSNVAHGPLCEVGGCVACEANEALERIKQAHTAYIHEVEELWSSHNHLVDALIKIASEAQSALQPHVLVSSIVIGIRDQALRALQVRGDEAIAVLRGDWSYRRSKPNSSSTG